MKWILFSLILGQLHGDILEKALPGFHGSISVNGELQEELLMMQEEDQAVRHDIEHLNRQRLRELAEKHNSRLKEIIQMYGWPGRSLVGIKGSFAMWLLVQHQDQDLEFQKNCLSLLKDAVERQDATLNSYAYLVDRVRKNENRPQLYGTQWEFTGTGFVLHPIEDLENLPRRRLEAGLDTMEEQEARCKALFISPSEGHRG